MSTRRFRLIGWGILALTLIAMACTVLPPQKETAQFFILTPAPQSAASGSSHPTARQLSIGLGPIDFPGYLKRREIVTRMDSDQLELSQSKYWAESLDSNFQRVLSQDLGQQLGTQRIVLFPWYGRPQIDYQVEVQVHRFDTDANNRAELDARWIIKDGRTGRELKATESHISSIVPAADIAGSETLSNDVNLLSTRIAQSLLGLSEGMGTAAELHSSSAARLSER
jgi:uncharacterized lipoprotein YmbA